MTRSFSISEAATLGVALLLILAIGAPLLLHAQEEARETSCRDRMAKLAKACLGYADANRDSLPSNRRQPHTSWNTLVLPYFEQQALYAQYDLSKDWWKEANQKVGATQVSGLVCPSAPHPQRKISLLDPDGNAFQAAATDYVASAGAYLHINEPAYLYRGAMASPGRHYGGSNVTTGHAVRLADITDGTAHTMVFVEMADKPNQWRAGKLHDQQYGEDDSAKPIVDGYSFGQWVCPNWNHLRSYDEAGEKQFGPCGVNCSNSGSIYGFHPGWANVAMADGSVQRLRAGLEEEVMVALVSIADAEVITSEDYQPASR